MKRIAAILLIFTHLLSIAGIVATVHYCGDKITEWKLENTDKMDCACSAIDRDDCCDDVTVIAQLKAESTPVESYKLGKSPVKALLVGALPNLELSLLPGVSAIPSRQATRHIGDLNTTRTLTMVMRV